MGEGRQAADLARYYDLDLQDDPGDVGLYRALAARTGGPVVEFASGTGRIAIPLSADGHAVTAVDLDPAMLDRARATRAARSDVTAAGSARRPGATEPAGEIRFVEADLLDVDLGERFGLAILALNSLLLLGTRERQGLALSALARHLRPDGRAVMDIWLPAADDLAAYDGRVILEWLRDDTERDERVAKLASARYDPATARVTLHSIFDAWPAGGGPTRRAERTDELRLVGADELAGLAREAGLEPETLAGDYELTPFGAGAERLVLVCRLL